MQYLRNAKSDFDPVLFYLFVFSSSVTYVITEKIVFTPPPPPPPPPSGLKVTQKTTKTMLLLKDHYPGSFNAEVHHNLRWAEPVNQGSPQKF